MEVPAKAGIPPFCSATCLASFNERVLRPELVELAGSNIHGCLACRTCSKHKDGHCSQVKDIGNACIDKMVAADDVLLGSPTYFSDLSPEIKALIDRAGLVAMANGGMFRRKVGAAVVAVRRAGAVHTFDSINHFFLISEMIIPGSTYWNIGYGLDPGDVSHDEEALRTMTALGRNMAWLLKRLNHATLRNDNENEQCMPS